MQHSSRVLNLDIVVDTATSVLDFPSRQPCFLNINLTEQPGAARPIMAAFQSKKFRSAADMNSFAMRYRRVMNKHPFLMFGLPFMGIIVAGSFVLTPATAVRYEKHDRKVRQMTKDEELNVRRSARKVDMKEEYYVRPHRRKIVHADNL